MMTRSLVDPRHIGLASLLVAALGLATGPGCSNKQQIPDPGPKPSGADFSGVWYSPQFEHMYLNQTGNKVTGVYTYEDGGKLEGKIDGNLLVFEWTDPGDKENAERTMSGRGYLQLRKGENKLKLKGEWGYDDQASGAGPWTAEFVRELESGDPMRLKDLDSEDF